MNHKETGAVVITGASAGVGRATARAFAHRHAAIGLLARGKAGLEAARLEVETAGGRALAIPLDVANCEQVEAAAEQIERTLGPIQIWINCAMVSVFSPVHEMSFDEVRRVTEVTYLGTVYGTMAALKRMRPRDRGTIVQVGSALAYRSIPLQSAYCGAKHGIRGFTDSLRSELIHSRSKVRITMVQLPAVNTPQFGWTRNRMPRAAQPVPPIFQPEVAAESIVWAAHHPRREVYVGMPSVKAIIGNKVIPGVLDHYLGRVGYAKQQTARPHDPATPDNLWQPLDDAPGTDRGAHGTFDGQASTVSPELWASQHREWFAAAVAALLGVGLGFKLAKQRD